MAKSDTKKTRAAKRPEDPGRRDFIVIATNAMATGIPPHEFIDSLQCDI